MAKATSPATIEAAERKARALRLRKQGKTFEEIGGELGISRQSAHKLVSSALKALPAEPAAELAALELERLDAMTAAVWPRAIAGDLPAVDRALRISERRAKLCGIDGRALVSGRLPSSMAAFVKALTPPEADADAAPSPRADAIARLDVLAELAWPAATAGDLAAVDRLTAIANARARLVGADRAPPDDGQPDSLKALCEILERSRAAAATAGAVQDTDDQARAAGAGPEPAADRAAETEPAASSTDAL